MLYKQKKITFFLLFFLWAVCLSAQDKAIAAIQKIYSSYTGNTSIHFTGNMKMYAKNEPLRIIDRLQSSYTLKNKNFHCSIGPVSMLMNDDYYVSVDNSDKLIMVGRKKDLPAMAGNPVLNLEQLKKGIADREIQATVTVNGTEGVLQLTDAAGSSGFISYRIEFTTATGYMKKVIMETGGSSENTGKIMVLEINYTAPSPAETASFSEKPFFSVINNQIQLTAAYKNYQIINQL